MAGTDMNMIQMPMKEFERQLKVRTKAGDMKPFLILGKSGVGKTQAIAQLAKEMGLGFVTVRLIRMTETDLMGIPFITADRTTDWAKCDMFPRVDRDGEEGILVIDEFTSASKEVQVAVSQLIEKERRMGNYELPPKWRIIALGNGPEDGGHFRGITNMTLSRFLCFRYKETAKEWIEWAVKAGIHPAVVAFIAKNEDMIHKFASDDPEEANLFPNPRTWEDVSATLKMFEEAEGKTTLEPEEVYVYAGLSVGSAVAQKFQAFYRYNSSIISAQDIINGRGIEELKTIKIEALYISIQSLTSRLRDIFSKYTDNDFEDSIPPEANKIMVNVSRWIAYVGKIQLDMVTAAFQTIQLASPYISLILTSVDFECVELESISSAIRRVVAVKK